MKRKGTPDGRLTYTAAQERFIVEARRRKPRPMPWTEIGKRLGRSKSSVLDKWRRLSGDPRNLIADGIEPTVVYRATKPWPAGARFSSPRMKPNGPAVRAERPGAHVPAASSIAIAA